jgi:hypothetical protein
MQISREWATPVTIGSFMLMAVTGILMFFHLDTGLNKEAHEWLGWAMVVGVVAHLLANLAGFKRYFARPAALAIVGVFAVILAGSFFVQEDEGGGNPVRKVMPAISSAPLSALAPLAHRSADDIVADLRAAGFKVASADQSIAVIVGPKREDQSKAIGVVFK